MPPTPPPPGDRRERADAARVRYAWAFQLLGLVAMKRHGDRDVPAGVFCPDSRCRQTTPHVKVFGGEGATPGWTCVKCRAHDSHRICPTCRTRFRPVKDGERKRPVRTCTGRADRPHDETRTVMLDAIGLLQLFGDLSFTDAVSRLLGEHTDGFEPPEPVDLTLAGSSLAEVPEEVIVTYEFARTAPGASISAAGEHYARWGHDPEVIANIGFFQVTDPDTWWQAMEAEFGLDLLVRAGWIKDRGEDKPPRRRYWRTVSDRHNVVEMQYRQGRPRTFQVRASTKLEEEIGATKDRLTAQLGRPPKYGELHEKVPPKTMNAVGIAEQPGFGEALLEWYAAEHPGATVAVVEGGKDYAAGRTLGLPVCAVAGTGAAISDEALEALRQLQLVICFDGDSEGIRNAEERAELFELLDVPVAGTHRSSCLAATWRYPPHQRLFHLDELLRKECRCSTLIDGEWQPAEPDGLDLTDCLSLLVGQGLWPPQPTP